MKIPLLIVDDDVDFCEVLARAFKRRDFDVLTAVNISQALAQQQHYSPTHAIIDLKIGEESGLALVKQLLTHDDTIKIVMLTGYASIATAIEAIKLGAVHYLTKPASPEQIMQALTEQSQGNVDMPIKEQPLSVQRLEWEHIQQVLHEHNGNISATARALKMHRRTLQRKLQKYPAKE